MKQVRKMSNLVAEELQEALNAQGIVLDESAFEERVSQIVSDIYESVEGDGGTVDEEVAITEDDKFYYATSECSIGGVGVKEGEYVEIEDTDEGAVATIYDEEGNIRESEVFVDDDDDYEDALEELGDDDIEDEEESDDEEEVEEAKFKKFKVKDGKKVKLSKNQIMKNKLKARGRLKKGYKFVDGKQVKMSSAEKRARKMAGRRLARKGKAKRMKSLKKARMLNQGSQSGTVTESFDIHAGDITFTVEAGDVIVMEDGMISVIREGVTVISGIAVSEGFMGRCVDESVMLLEGKNCKDCDECGSKGVKEGDEDEEDEEDEANEAAALLTFKSNVGYVLVREGKELPMGNRVRARATLMSEGFNVTSAMLDSAVNGKIVTL